MTGFCFHKYPRDVYAIFAYDDDHVIRSVYIGSSNRVFTRILAHRCFGAKGQSKTPDMYEEFHEKMRRNGYIVRILDRIVNRSCDWYEYMWMRVFRERTKLTVVNRRTEDHKKVVNAVDITEWLKRPRYRWIYPNK